MTPDVGLRASPSPDAAGAQRPPGTREIALSRAAALAVLALGAAVLAGWGFGIAALKTVLPGLTAMVPNTALCFVLAGLALALAPRKTIACDRTARALALAVVAIAALTLFEILTGADLGIDQLLFADPGSPQSHPGRMATATGVAFTAAGSALFVLPRLSGMLPGLRLEAVGALSVAVAAIGSVGLLGYALDLEILYSWYAYSSVALHTAVGLTVLGAGMWLAWIRQRPPLADAQRIATRAALLVTLAAAAVGVLGFAAVEQQTRATLAHGFEETLRAHTSYIHSTIQGRAERTAIVGTRPNLLQHLRLLAADPGNAESRITVQGIIDSFATHGFTAIVLMGRDGVDIARFGRPIESATQELTLDPHAGISIVWSDGASYLRRKLPLADAEGPLGTVLAEQLMPELTAALLRAGGFGRTSELMLCSPRLDGFECLPTRRTPRAFNLRPGAEGFGGLARRAFHGEQGFAPGFDQRGERALVGYAPIGAFSLVTLLSVEAAEIYRPLARQFQLALLLIAGTSLAGYVLLRRWVLPLADSLDQRVRDRTADLATATSELARSEQRFRATIESAPAAMALIDSTGRIAVVNAELERMFGYHREELIHQTVEVLIPERFRSVHAGLLARYSAAPEARPMGAGRELSARRKDASEFPVEIGLSPLRAGPESFVIATILDVTERRRSEAALRGANEALKRSNIELQRFAHVASHDLQTPMRSIASFAGLLQSTYADQLDERARDWIRRITRAVSQLQALIRDLLEYSSIDARSHPFEPVPLQEVFEHVVSLLDAAVRESGAEITRDELPVVKGDRSQLVQLMLNLAGNGLKYRGAESPRIHVFAERTGDGWKIGVRDNGIGIAPRHQEQIFEIFERLHDQREHPGSGVGLALCRRVVQRHGGRIWVESGPGCGSVFYFTIPEEMERPA